MHDSDSTTILNIEKLDNKIFVPVTIDAPNIHYTRDGGKLNLNGVAISKDANVSLGKKSEVIISGNKLQDVKDQHTIKNTFEIPLISTIANAYTEIMQIFRSNKLNDKQLESPPELISKV